MINNKKAVLIAVLNQGVIRPELATVLTELPLQNKYELHIYYPARKPIAQNRNMIVQKFLSKPQYDYLIMIDSVSGDTPLLIRKDGFVDFVEIQELYQGRGNRGRLRQKVRQDIEVLTRNGWKKINYLKKHKVKKPLYIISGDGGVSKTTGDHSLFKDGKDIKASELEIGDKIDKVGFTDSNKLRGITEDFARVLGFFVAEGSCRDYKIWNRKKTKKVIHYSWALNNNNKKLLEEYKRILEEHYASRFYFIESKKKNYKSTWKLVPINAKEKVNDFRKWCYTKKSSLKKVPRTILNSDKKIIKAFLRGYFEGDGSRIRGTNGSVKSESYQCDTNSYILAAGLEYLNKKIGWKISTHIRKDKPNIITLSQRRYHKKEGITKIIKIEDFNDYVYDISTEDGSFVGGVGNILYHNSDNVPPLSLLNLVDYQKDIIGVLYCGFQKAMIVPFVMRRTPDGLYKVMDFSNKKGLIEVDAIGTGVIVIKREVLEKLRHPFRNEYDADGIKLMGLDFNFCKRAKELGFKVYCHLDYVTSHWVTMDLKDYYGVVWENDQFKKELMKKEKEINKLKQGQEDEV